MRHKRYASRSLRHAASMPFIWIMILPLVVLDAMTELYHRVCFPLYGLRYVRRWNYIKMDRHRLPYLPWSDKLNCAYCSYAVGLLHYVSTIAAETEKYWCGIKHQARAGFLPPAHHDQFLEYGDERGFARECRLGKKRLRRRAIARAGAGMPPRGPSGERPASRPRRTSRATEQLQPIGDGAAKRVR